MAKSHKTFKQKISVLLEQIEHGNREEKRVGRQKMKAAITSSEHVSLVGRGKVEHVSQAFAHCAPTDFSSSGIQNPLLCNHDNVLLN